jgi:hypothetical protein
VLPVCCYVISLYSESFRSSFVFFWFSPPAGSHSPPIHSSGSLMLLLIPPIIVPYIAPLTLPFIHTTQCFPSHQQFFPMHQHRPPFPHRPCTYPPPPHPHSFTFAILYSSTLNFSLSAYTVYGFLISIITSDSLQCPEKTLHCTARRPRTKNSRLFGAYFEYMAFERRSIHYAPHLFATV